MRLLDLRARHAKDPVDNDSIAIDAHLRLAHPRRLEERPATAASRKRCHDEEPRIDDRGSDPRDAADQEDEREDLLRRPDDPSLRLELHGTTLRQLTNRHGSSFLDQADPLIEHDDAVPSRPALRVRMLNEERTFDDASSRDHDELRVFERQGRARNVQQSGE